MTTSLKLLGWSATGFRCPDHQLDFSVSDADVHRVSLVQMPNGTGKTTTLELLRATLSGQAGHWSADQVRNYRKRGSNSDSGRFQVSLLHNGLRLTIVLILDFVEGIARYTTTGQTGQEKGFVPPRELRQFLSEEFVDFFVFDGELAKQLLDPEHTDAQRAIESLFRLSTLNLLALRVEQYWEEAVSGKTATAQKGRARRQNKVAYLQNRLQVLTAQKTSVSTKLATKEEELERLKLRFDEKLANRDDVMKKHGDAKARLQQASAAVTAERKSVLERMRSPQALSLTFASMVLELRDNLDRVKLPESAAREFFEELVDEACCVCGREMDEGSKSNIRLRAKSYFGTDDMALLNAMKTDIADYVGVGMEEHSRALNGAIQALSDSVEMLAEAEDDLQFVESQAVRDDPSLEEGRKRIEDLSNECRTLRETLDGFDESIDLGDEQSDIDKTNGIELIKAKLKKAETYLAEITETLDLKNKTRVLKQILTTTHESAKLLLGNQLCKITNERIQNLMPHNAIALDRIDASLVLAGREGGSVGETLSVAYAFLSTLFNQSTFQLPFIVDSPAGPIDLAIRPKIARLIPQLTTQFVAFTISTERSGFVGPLSDASKGDVQHITLFRQGSAPYVKADNALETEDGVVIVGGTYFEAFQVEEER